MPNLTGIVDYRDLPLQIGTQADRYTESGTMYTSTCLIVAIDVERLLKSQFFYDQDVRIGPVTYRRESDQIKFFCPVNTMLIPLGTAKLIIRPYERGNENRYTLEFLSHDEERAFSITRSSISGLTRRLMSSERDRIRSVFGLGNRLTIARAVVPAVLPTVTSDDPSYCLDLKEE